jgi:hypothetical protein
LKLGSLVHFLYLLEEIVLGFISLEFEGRSQNVILRCKGNVSKMEDSRDLEAMESSAFRLCCNFTLNEVDDLLVLQNLLVVSSNAIFAGPFFENRLVRDYDSD